VQKNESDGFHSRLPSAPAAIGQPRCRAKRHAVTLPILLEVSIWRGKAPEQSCLLYVASVNVCNYLALHQLEDQFMFSLIKELGVRVAVRQEAVPFLIAFAIAEFFFKFKSFALECVAFLAVWALLSFVQSVIFPSTRGQRPTS
jgi:hypothetical protein